MNMDTHLSDCFIFLSFYFGDLLFEMRNPLYRLRSLLLQNLHLLSQIGLLQQENVTTYFKKIKKLKKTGFKKNQMFKFFTV